MDISAGIRAQMAAVMSVNSGMSVSVVFNGQSGSGMRSMGNDQSMLQDIGETGQRTETIRISAATFAEPKRDSTIIVAGKNVKVTSVDLDAVGALYTVRYIETQPVE